MGQILDNLGINPKVLLVQVALFLTVFAVLSRFLFARIAAHLRRRDEEMQEALAEIEKRAKDAEALAQEYQSHLRQIERDAQERIQAAAREGMKARAEIQERATRTARDQIERARREIAADKERVFAELVRRVSDLTLDATRKVLAEEVDADAHRRAVQRHLQERES